MNKNTKIKVRNRSHANVGYTIPDMSNLHRTYEANEVKEVTFEELQRLSYRPGGSYILQHYLVIDNLEARDELLGDVELEYNYTEANVKNLLEHGTLDELLDCLDFAPLGVIDLVKTIAVQIELNDVRKRKAVLDKLGFNVDTALQFNKEAAEEEEKAEKTARRVATPVAKTAATATTARRAAAPAQE
jgi:hypothetical protein